MRKLRNRAFTLLTVWGLVLVFGGGVCQAQEPYSSQWIGLYSETGFLGAWQAFGGWNISDIGTSKTLFLSMRNTSITGLFNLNSGIGSVKNQGSVIQVDLFSKGPGVALPTTFFLGSSVMEDNRLTLGDASYMSTITANSMTGSGLMAVNLMAGNMNNQFTSVRLSVGPHQPQEFTAPVPDLSKVDSGLVTLSNSQLQTISVQTNNEVVTQGSLKASATIEDQALKNFAGVGAISNVAGNLNQVVNNLQVQIITAK